MKVMLSKPIEAHGEQINELTFRAPRAGDLRGLQLSLSGSGLTFDTGVILDLAAKLAGVPPSTLDVLPLTDAIEIAGKVGPFLDGLVPSLMTTSETSSSPED